VRALSGSRNRAIVAATFVALGGLAIGAAVVGLSPSQRSVSSPRQNPPSEALVGMEGVAPEDFVALAEDLPDELVEALDRDLGITGEQYLSEAAASEDAIEIVAALEEAGVIVLGSRMNGTKLTVNVDSAQDAAIVETAGGVAEIGKPIVEDFSQTIFESYTDVHGGVGVYLPPGYRCTLGFTGYSLSGGAQALTAGHCGTDTSSGATLKLLEQSGPTSVGGSPTFGATLGTLIGGSVHFGGGYDTSRIAVSDENAIQPAIALWGGGTGAPLSSTLSITGQGAGIKGATLCKSGSTTGWSCGTVVAVDESVSVGGSTVNSVVATTCADQGDSGGSAVIGQRAVGLLSGGTTGISCSNEDFRSVFFPIVAGDERASVTTAYGTDWELAVKVSQPAVTGAGAGDGITRGTLANASAASSVRIFVDESPTMFGSTSASSGEWTIPLTGLEGGDHTFTVQGVWGTHSTSALIAGIVTVGEGPAAITAAWNASGGASGPLGYATAVTLATAAAGLDGFEREFQGGVIVWTNATGAHILTGGIRSYYDSLGGPDSSLGWPVADQRCTAGVCAQEFQNGLIWRSSSGVASTIQGEIFDYYRDKGGNTGTLGQPIAVASSFATSNGDGLVQVFQGGYVYSSAVGVFTVKSGTLTAKTWAGAGWIRGSLGWPAAEEVCSSGVCSQEFQGGTVQGSTIVPNVSDPVIAAYWSGLGGAGGVLGNPTISASSFATSNGDGLVQVFQGGYVYSSAVGVFTVKSGTLTGKTWAGAGWIRGSLGWPAAEEVCSSGVCSQEFQGGTVQGSTIVPNAD
jgi:hypothetical protein